MTEIINNLYLCSWDEAKQLVPTFSVVLVVNCTKDLETLGVKTIRIPVDDHGEIDDTIAMNNHIDNAIEFINATLQQGITVVVHCRAGRQRSATVIAAYLIRYHGYSLENVIEFMKSKKREVFFPQVNFMETLKLIEII